jgi:ADP-ribose pyrophosphatase YjhB (NUDIX family)
VLFVDEQGRWLILKPTYKEGWLIPGGTVEAGEPPRLGAIREAWEETRLEVRDPVLCGVHYVAAQGVRTESVRFTFFGGVLDASRQAQIVVAPGEIAEHRFVTSEEAVGLLGAGFAEGLRQAAEAAAAGKVAYTES